MVNIERAPRKVDCRVRDDGWLGRAFYGHQLIAKVKGWRLAFGFPGRYRPSSTSFRFHSAISSALAGQPYDFKGSRRPEVASIRSRAFLVPLTLEISPTDLAEL